MSVFKPGARVDSRGKGFTLLEVLIALTVIALVLPPLLINAAERVNGIKVMEEKIIANLVAQNLVAQYRLESRLAGNRPPRREDGSELMAGRDWYWEIETEATEIENYFRLNARVGTNKDLKDPRVTVSAYLGVPQ